MTLLKTYNDISQETGGRYLRGYTTEFLEGGEIEFRRLRILRFQLPFFRFPSQLLGLRKII